MAKQYQKSCRDCDKTIYMLEQNNGTWRAFDDAEHHILHECKKNQGSSPATGQADTAQKSIGNSAPANSPSSQPEVRPDTFTQLLNSKDFEAKVRLIARDLLSTPEFENKMRLIARNEIEKMLKKAMAF
jgi:hypothetical protein